MSSQFESKKFSTTIGDCMFVVFNALAKNTLKSYGLFYRLGAMLVASAPKSGIAGGNELAGTPRPN